MDLLRRDFFAVSLFPLKHLRIHLRLCIRICTRPRKHLRVLKTRIAVTPDTNDYVYVRVNIYVYILNLIGGFHQTKRGHPRSKQITPFCSYCNT